MKIFQKLLERNFLLRIYILFVTILVLLFGRSGEGLYVFGRRIGEYVIFILFCIAIWVLLTRNSRNLFEKIFSIYFFYFLLNFLTIGFEFPTSFRYSSFVVVYGMLIIIDEIYTDRSLVKLFNFTYFLSILCILIYSLSRFNRGYLFGELFERYSDKPYEFFKPSEISVVVIFILFFAISRISNKRIIYTTLFICGYVFTVLIKSSRGATLGMLVGLFLIFIFSENKKKAFIYIIIVISASALFISIDLDRYIENNSEFIEVDEASNKSKYFQEYDFEIAEIDYESTTNCGIEKFSFSKSFTDTNILWRVTVFEDVLNCTSENFSTLIFGNGFKEAMKPLLNPWKNGRDGLNNFPHNFLLTIFYRLGLLGLFLNLLIIYLIIRKNESQFPSVVLITFLTVSLFDVVFEGVTQLVFWLFIYLENNRSRT